MKYRIREKRKEAGLSQETMASLMDISIGQYNMLENGKRRMNETHLEGIAKALKMRASDLIVDEDDEGAGEFVDLFLGLSSDERQQAVSYMRFLRGGGEEKQQTESLSSDPLLKAPKTTP